jgi:YVTN family beta-propeller protein
MMRGNEMKTATFLAVLAFVASASGQYLETTIHIGGNPDALLWNPVSNKVYCADRDNNHVTIIDGRTLTVIDQLHVSGEPLELTLNARYNKVYCTCIANNRVVVIDGVGDTVIARVMTDDWPTGMAYDTIDDRLYVTCYDVSTLYVLDGVGDTVVARIDAASLPDPGSPVWQPVTNRVFWPACPDSLVTIDCATNSILRVTYTGPDLYGGDGGCYNPVNGLTYFGWWVRAVNPTGDSVVANVSDCLTECMCFAPFPNKIFTGQYGPEICVIDCDSHVVRARFHTGGLMRSILCDSLRGKVYALDWGAASRGVTVFDARGDTILLTIPIDYPTGSLALDPERGRVYAAGYGSGTISVIRDSSTAIAETPDVSRQRQNAGATVLRVVPEGELYDATGRRVTKPGPGVYFVREKIAGSAEQYRMRKVIITR